MGVAGGGIATAHLQQLVQAHNAVVVHKHLLREVKLPIDVIGVVSRVKVLDDNSVSQPLLPTPE